MGGGGVRGAGWNELVEKNVCGTDSLDVRARAENHGMRRTETN